MHFKKRKRKKTERCVPFCFLTGCSVAQLSHDPTCLPHHDQLYPQNEPKENPF